MYDISERRRAEEERDFQARLLQSISDAVIAYDTDLTVTSWNRAAQALYGWAPEEVLGNPLPEPLRREAADAAVWDPFVDALHGWRGQSCTPTRTATRSRSRLSASRCSIPTAARAAG